ncbi:MAG: hypothetical protein LQ338_001212 [Usnochroma carphineum]|nr:MAG: hypothetical protein LQ338_001212 [Usnochroma carphineum]
MDEVDERPLALRRKRRATSALIDPVPQETVSQPAEVEMTTDDAPRNPPKTPGNRKKRIRFSEPLEITASSSTGLTPAFNRTKLLPANAAEAARKRLSLPTRLTNAASSPQSSQLSNLPSATVIQVAPLIQAIDSRTMRLLKRNHLGEKINEIYAERRKSKLALLQELDDLRKQLALAKERPKEASEGTEASIENSGRIAELENELVSLKQEMRERSAAIDTTIPQQPDEHDAMADTGFADGVENFSEQVLFVGNINKAVTNIDEARSPNSVVEASTQVDFPSPSLSDVCRSARLSFEYLFPGENTLELEVSDPQPLIEAMISRVGTLKAEVEQRKQTLAVTETSTSNMEKHFKDALARLESARNHFETLKGEYEEEKFRASSKALEASTMEARWEQADDKRREVEQQRDEQRRSIERLQPALEYYQHEVKQLTQTIMDLESSHEASVTKLRTELADDSDAALACQQLAYEDVKSDLEAQVAAETTGRRKAEESAVERLNRIKELETRQKELQSAVHEKQSIIRDLESEIEATKSGHENEVGQLNVRIAQLVSDLSSTNAELAAARNEATRLANHVEQEKAAGLNAVEAMRSEVKKCSNNVDAVRDHHAEGVKKRGEEVARSFGLMTPVVEGGKFRDAEADEKVEGHVQYVRGKKRVSRPDSGVEVWGSIVEEDEEIGEGGVVMEG